MSEKPESDEFEDEEADEPVIGDGDVDLDQVDVGLCLSQLDGSTNASQSASDDNYLHVRIPPLKQLSW